MDRFFAETLEDEKQCTGSPWNSIYTVFSGGDDLLAVGPWDIVLDFAWRVRSLFDQTFGYKSERSCSHQPLTISGVAIIKPRYPIHLAAQQARTSLNRPNTNVRRRLPPPRTGVPPWGLCQWKDHETIIRSGKQLADWVDAGTVQRGWPRPHLHPARRPTGNPANRLASAARSFVPHLPPSRGHRREART